MLPYIMVNKASCVISVRNVPRASKFLRIYRKSGLRLSRTY